MEKSYKDSRKSEHAFTAIEKDLRKGDIPSVILLCGVEGYLVRYYTDALIKRYVSDVSKAIDLNVLEKDSLTLDRIKEGLETVSIMSERKVVLIQDFLKPGQGQPFPESDLKELIKYMRDIPQESMLIMTMGDDRSSSITSLKTGVKKAGRIYDFQVLNQKQLYGFIEKRLRASGKNYRPSIVGMIAADSGYGNKSIDYDLYTLENDIKKIIAYSSDGEIKATDINTVLSVNPENNVFAMIDAIGRNRKDEALRLLSTLLDQGSKVFSLLGLITSQLELILSVREMLDAGMGLKEMEGQLKVHSYRLKKSIAVARQYSRPRLKSFLREAYEVDENIKTGLFPDTLALEYLIARI